MLVATMNPCPCGYYGDPTKECSCSSNQILNYQKHLSGPLMDRIDMIVAVSRVPSDQFINKNPLSSSQHDYAKKAIKDVSKRQLQRYDSCNKYNGFLSNSEIKRFINLSPEVKSLLDAASEKLGLSARGYFKVIKVAQTIADLDGADNIETKHISEALQYRQNH